MKRTVIVAAAALVVTRNGGTTKLALDAEAYMPHGAELHSIEILATGDARHNVEAETVAVAGVYAVRLIFTPSEGR